MRLGRKKKNPNAEKIAEAVRVHAALGREREQTIARLVEIETLRAVKLAEIREAQGDE